MPRLEAVLTLEVDFSSFSFKQYLYSFIVDINGQPYLEREQVEFASLRMLTDPNCPGTEKLAVSAIKPELLTCPHMPVRLSEITAEKTDSLPPMSLFLVKGWSRCVAMTACLLHAYESESGVFEAPSR